MDSDNKEILRMFPERPILAAGFVDMLNAS